MIFKHYLVYIFAITSFTQAVKVNMKGSLKLGKEVMDTLAHYIRYQLPHTNGRRSMNGKSDLIRIEIETAALCKNLPFCKEHLEKFVNEYVMSLIETVDDIFDGILKPEGKSENILFYGKLKGFLSAVRKVLKTANDKSTGEGTDEAYLWVEVVKKISSKLEKKTIKFLDVNLEVNLEVNSRYDIGRKLKQALVIGIAIAEGKAQKRLCYEFHLCLSPNYCTVALHTLLGRAISLPNQKINIFINAFRDELAGSNFYSNLSPATAIQFQGILRDMSLTDDVITKDVLNAVLNALESRLSTMETSSEMVKGQDVQLVHVILSDMDFMFSKQKSDPFDEQLNNFSEWMSGNGKIASNMKDTIKNIEKQLLTESQDLVTKLVNEVRVFLEITVD